MSFLQESLKINRLKTPASSNRFQLVLAFLAGMLLAASFAKLNLPWLAWLAPGLILWAVRGATGKAVLRVGFVAGLGHYLISLYWLLLIPFPWHALVGYLGVCAVHSFYMASWCWMCWRLFPKSQLTGELKKKKTEAWQYIGWPIVCAAAWVAMEMMIARVMTGFPWDLLGVSQFRFLSLIQIASITGVYGVSYLVVWVSVALMSAMWFWQSSGKSMSSALLQMVVPMVAIACVVVFGRQKLSQPEEAGARLRIALVQPAIPQRVVWDPAEKTNRFLKLMELSRAALASRTDLLVWPEAAMPDMFGRNGYTQAAVASLVQSEQIWMVMGAADTSPRPGATTPTEVDHFNGAFLINPKGDLADRYYKRHLVLFGEYMPGARWLPFLARFRSAGAGVVPGARNASFQIEKPQAKFPVLICFEDVFPHEARLRVDANTDFMLNLTSDAWFGESAAHWQQAETALFRAVENGVPLVRCANNGLTCWIDSRGRLHNIYFSGSDNIYEAGYKLVEVPLRSNESKVNATFYNRHGDWFGWGCVGLTAIILMRTFFQRTQVKLARKNYAPISVT